MAAASAMAQTFPSRPLEVVVHTSPGGGTDILARVVSDILTRNKWITQPINVSNRPGGGGAIAYNYIKSKRGDPHAVMAVASLTMLTVGLRPDMQLGPEHYTPIAFLAQDPQALMVPVDAPYKTFKEFIEVAKRDPGALTASITTPGGSGQLLVWLIERATGTKYKTVSFKAGSEAIMQVMGGHVHFTTENIGEALSAVEGKKLRVLAVSSGQRLSVVPDVPTLKELGYDIHFGTGRGFAMAAGVPKEAAAHFEAQLERVYKSPEWKDHTAKHLWENLWMGSAEYAKHLAFRRVQQLEFMQSIGLAPKP
ncbi:MAG: tripartite tricarboxylate transporter substrate binding protein [Burkholderiales bacterium]